MRYILGLLAAFLFLAAWPIEARAQGRTPGPVVTDSLIDSYVTRLNLTNEQESQLRSILEGQSEKARELMGEARTQGRDAMQAMRPKMQELQADTNAQVEQILTDEQIPEYRRIQAEIQERRRSMRRPPPPQ